jgi:hypothetical protein
MRKRNYAALAVTLLFIGCGGSQGGAPQTPDASTGAEMARPAADHRSLGQRDPASCEGAWGVYVVNLSNSGVTVQWSETMADRVKNLGGVAARDSGIAYFYSARRDLPQVWLLYRGNRLYVDGTEDLSGYRLRAVMDCNTEAKKEQ